MTINVLICLTSKSGYKHFYTHTQNIQIEEDSRLTTGVLKMGLEGNESLGQFIEKEGGTVGATTKPVDDRINDPKSKSNHKSNIINQKQTYTNTYL